MVKENDLNDGSLVKWVGIGILCIFLLLMCVWITVMLGVSQRAVVFNRFSGQMTKELHTGFNMINPLTDSVEIYDLKIVKTDYLKIEGLSSDMQTTLLDLTVNWKLDGEKLSDIYRTIHGNIEETIMINAVIDTAKTELGKFRVEEIARNREKLKMAVEDNLKVRLKEKYIDVINVSIVNIDFSDKYETAIEAKLVAEQAALEAKNKKEQVRYEAEAKGIENRNLAETITPLVLKQKWIEAWSRGGAQVPLIVSGDGGGFILDLKELGGLRGK